MTIITILLGLAGLGVVVFFHELGHFLAARAVGVEVEEFSLGWGPQLFGFTRGKTHYRVSVLPIGGYCKMKGEDSYRQAIDQHLDEFPREPGSYFGAHPLKRILIALAGPAFNVILAFAIYVAIAGIGYTMQSWPNRVVLASDYNGAPSPADAAGIQTGDRILSVDGTDIRGYSDIQERFALSAGDTLELVLERNGAVITTQVTPVLDKETGAGRVGLYPWIEPVVRSTEGSAALSALEPGDRVSAIDGRPVAHVMDLELYLDSAQPQKPVITYVRNGQSLETSIMLSYSKGAPGLGVQWLYESTRVTSDGILDALGDGLRETGATIAATYRGLASLFQGVDVLKAVSGPARITWTVGQVATESLSSEAGGMYVTASFLALLSIGLFAMNLLPIPLLDGGWIVLFVLEFIRGKAAKVKTVLRYQTIGFVAVAGLFLLTTVADILFFSGR